MLLADFIATVRGRITTALAALGVQVITSPRTERVEWHAWYGYDVEETDAVEHGGSEWTLSTVLIGSVPPDRRDAVISAYAQAVHQARETLSLDDVIIAHYAVQCAPSDQAPQWWTTILEITARRIAI
ncbi:MAG: hypothetical protein KatS3mg038_1111 [Candidatus Kapaibacterium sp.]|nr:MAG: hypothetical protein KatS3mg038_1111 [Candidatus Kapabacteria bacterium]